MTVSKLTKEQIEILSSCPQVARTTPIGVSTVWGTLKRIGMLSYK